MDITLYPIKIGDRGRRAPGWLILSEGAVRGLLTRGDEGEILFALHFDQRIRPADDVMIFQDLGEARAWLERRLMRHAPHARE